MFAISFKTVYLQIFNIVYMKINTNLLFKFQATSRYTRRMKNIFKILIFDKM